MSSTSSAQPSRNGQGNVSKSRTTSGVRGRELVHVDPSGEALLTAAQVQFHRSSEVRSILSASISPLCTAGRNATMGADGYPMASTHPTAVHPHAGASPADAGPPQPGARPGTRCWWWGRTACPGRALLSRLRALGVETWGTSRRKAPLEPFTLPLDLADRTSRLPRFPASAPPCLRRGLGPGRLRRRAGASLCRSLDGLLRLAEGLLNQGTRVVLLSSDAVTGRMGSCRR